MNIFNALKTDHRNVKALLAELSATPEKAIQKRVDLLAKIKTELVAHNEAEERVFYSQLNEKREDRLLVFEGKDEHRIGGQVIEELEATDKGTEEWTARVKVLKDLVEHHIEEEEGEIHKQAQKELTEKEADALGKEFTALKNEIITALKTLTA